MTSLLRIGALLATLALVAGCTAPAPPSPPPQPSPTVVPTPPPVPTATTTVAPTPLPATATPLPSPTEEPRLALQALADPPRRVREAAPPEVTAQSVAILEEDSADLLYGSHEHDRVAPASITKIATTLVALEREPDLGRRIDVTISGADLAARTGSSIMGLERGENVSVLTLLYGMMLPTGNDAAEQVALALAGDRETYVSWMNQRVLQLGLRDTHSVNPSGLDASSTGAPRRASSAVRHPARTRPAPSPRSSCRQHSAA